MTNCCCSSKCGLLGNLEQKIMEVLWSSEIPLNPRSVLEKLKGDYAYTTIMTVLKRMADKKIVKRESAGKFFVYSPLSEKEEYSCKCLDDLLSRLHKTYGQIFLDRIKKFKS
jgi:predicted transcriptional regulator